MKLATLNSDSPDGRLVVVSEDNTHCVAADGIAPNLLAAVEDWINVAPQLLALSDALRSGEVKNAVAFDPASARAPLPRSWQWLDGSAFPQHGELMQKAFNLPPIDSGRPLMYQGMSDRFYGPSDAVPFLSEKAGIDFEGEFGVIVDTVPMGTSAKDAMAHIKLIVQINDWSLRAVAPVEMKTGFGFVNAKPACSMAAVAVTPTELGDAWKDGRVHLPLHVEWNDKRFGEAIGDEMEYGFHELVAHAANSRELVAGTIIGSGTVSNKNYADVGSSCISERRAIDMIDFGEARTPFMSFGDTVRMEARSTEGQALFGPIYQTVIQN
ncbi:2-keto-4-pentenoate hydratase [Litorimonas cladophorae]|uniref:2-keto-4-pentenoate hydratase n=1 Tax=Litorimonas cladophorae TaxID=1220491 RepID=A0A918KHX0_9PROT|nr:fumarylacetoacetate hydrolase family protein [Litorimonas cladophorae]GGX63214.1 2-keto-4-pentenoate hydratase [Litorimonas cladophorae]